MRILLASNTFPLWGRVNSKLSKSNTYGGSIRFYLADSKGFKLSGPDSDYELGAGQLYDCIRFGQNMSDSRYSEGTVNMVNWVDPLEDISIDASYSGYLPLTNEPEIIKIKTTGTTKNGSNAGLYNHYYDGSSTIRYRACISEVTIPDMPGISVKSASNYNEDYLELAVGPEIYTAMNDTDTELKLPVTIKAQTLSESGAPIKDNKVVEETVTLTLKRPKVKISHELSGVTADLPDEVYCATPIQTTLTSSEYGVVVMPDKLNVFAGMQNLPRDSYNYEVVKNEETQNYEGKLSIPADYVKGEVRISADGTRFYYIETKLVGKGEVTESMVYPKGTQVELKATPDEGYVFKHWLDINQNVLTANPCTVAATERQCYTAVTEPVNYTVVYDANKPAAHPGKVSGSMDNSTFAYDTKYTLAKNNYELIGYEFKGWADTPDGEVAYADEAIVENLATDGNKVLYAVWERTKFDYFVVGYDVDESNGKGYASIYTIDKDEDRECTVVFVDMDDTVLKGVNIATVTPAIGELTKVYQKDGVNPLDGDDMVLIIDNVTNCTPLAKAYRILWK